MSTPDSPSTNEANGATQPSYAPPAGYGYAAPAGPPAPQYAPPPYGVAPGYPYAGAPAYGYPLVKTNVLSVISLVASIVGFFWILPFFGPLTAVITGHIALGQIRRRGEKGRGMALAGVIVGYVGLAVILGIVFLITISVITSSSYR
ncbi:DUF4190 domain-containing protein [Microbacterium sp. SLBN-146]|uniref:DUF4190 domain-containing protein n=1 Tax=Microbacterium sp. SLBN-146 TaxID=2768457 RepID=UPI00135A5753|nr:DUF4190 domain-containing protein [Microbacterium sp. SLBN-146]